MSRRIFVVTAHFPLPDTGAADKDRLEGIHQLRRLGFSVRVAAKILPSQDRFAIMEFSERNGIPIDLFDYSFLRKKSLFQKMASVAVRMGNPLYWDGAAYEYTDRVMRRALCRIADEWRPDLVLFDYSYLWPLYSIFRRRGIPIITRSINIEALHFLDEGGFRPQNWCRFFVKFLSEMMTLWKSDRMLSIAPKEKAVYERWGGRGKVENLPLRNLPAIPLRKNPIEERDVLHISYVGANFMDTHNRKALEFIVREVAPLAEVRAPGVFRFHIFGKKMPEEMIRILPDYIEYHGYIANLTPFFETMDIALTPSLAGAGMQQKIFEPLLRGIPTVTSPRGIAGYPFIGGTHVLLARSADDYVKSLIRLRDVGLRRALARNSSTLCRELFSQPVLDRIMSTAISQCLG